jgi:hypothetical protein
MTAKNKSKQSRRSQSPSGRAVLRPPTAPARWGSGVGGARSSMLVVQPPPRALLALPPPSSAASVAPPVFSPVAEIPVYTPKPRQVKLVRGLIVLVLMLAFAFSIAAVLTDGGAAKFAPRSPGAQHTR